MGRPLRLLFLGDSSAAGVGVDTQARALTGRTVEALAHHYCVTWLLLAETGMTTRRMLARLAEHPPTEFDVAVTALGVNDVTSGRALPKWLEEQRRLWEVLRVNCGVSQIVVSGLPPMHRFPALPQPLRWYLGRRATQFDRALIDVTKSHSDCHFVTFRHRYDASAIAADGFHPGAIAYADWGQRVAQLIRETVGDDVFGNYI